MKLGFISFGGPAGQIAIMHQELVENRRWISESRFFSTHSISVWCCPVRKLSNLPPTLAG
jgi:chromate transport protein ChrA